MIRRIENLDAVKLELRSSHYSRLMLAHLHAYGTEFDFCELYQITAKSVIGYIVCFNSTVVADYVDLSNVTRCSIREIAEFIAFKSPSVIELPKELTPKTGFRGYQRIKRSFFDVPFGANAFHLVETDDYDRVFNTVYDTESSAQYGLWLTDTVRRRNRGMSRIYSYLSSVLTVRYMLNGYAYLTDVATPPVDRGKGQAAELLCESSFALYKESYKTYLCAKEPQADYYRYLNYPETGNDYIFEKKEKIQNDQLF